MLQEDYLRVSQASDRIAFQDAIVDFAHKLGFSTISAVMVLDQLQAENQFITVGNTPQAFIEASRNLADSQRDPVLQRLKRLNVPVIWDQSTYVQDAAGDLWEEQAPYGYHTGIAMALHLPEGKHFLLGVDRDRPLPRRDSVRTRIVADLQLLAVHAQDAAMRLLTGPNEQAERPSLTRRECEVLKWTMVGKSAWTIAQILHISEATVVFHLNNARNKLGTASKHQAVLKALRLGLI